MRRFLAGVALSALMFASSANAATHTLNLTADFGDLTQSQFTFDGRDYDTGQLQLTGFEAFTIEDGDTIEATVTITGGPFVIAAYEELFIGLDLFNFAGTDPIGDLGAAPLSPNLIGTFSFDGGAPVAAGCSNCLHFIRGTGANTETSFTTLVASGTVSLLAEPYDVDRIQVSYQGSSLAVPEPGAWALMILGFGGAGAMLRRQRKTDTCAAA